MAPGTARRSPGDGSALATLRHGARSAWLDGRWSWVAPGVAAAAVAVVYLVLDPRTSDLPAHLFRADLFGREGFTIWSNAWYGGHHVPAYSVLFPPLAWLLGPRLVGAAACVLAAVLFERIVRHRYGEAARWGALWLGVGVGSLLFTERLTFALGAALGMGAALALQRDRPWLAALLGVAASLGSPVAGLFVAMAGVAYAGAARVGSEGRGGSAPASAPRVRAGLGLAAAALVPILLLTVVFPERGPFPFDLSAYVGVPLLAGAALFLLPRGERAIRIGAILYLLGATAALLLETGVGGNVARLGSLLGGPLLAAALLGRTGTRSRTTVLAVALVALAYWQWSPAVRTTADTWGDPSVEAAYHEPLLDRLEADPPAGRLEIPFLRSHFETAYVAPHFPLARGWERQLDIERNPLFYEEDGLEHDEYEAWLRENAVSHVALADVPNDYSSEEEQTLVEEEPPYLEPVWRSEDWRLYEVSDPEPLASAEGDTRVTMEHLEATSFTLDFREAGAALVRVRFTPYWLAEGACVEPAGEWTRVTADASGQVRVAPSFAPGRIGSEARRCG